MHSESVLFEEDFQDGLKDGWTWVREHPAAWRVSESGLEILVEPGNMWGPANDAKNVLVRPLPETEGRAVRVSATVANDPTGQYEQIDLVWYYNDSHMVKIGLELVHGELSLVMGREEADQTQTICIQPVTAKTLDLRFTVRGHTIHGEYRPHGTEAWLEAGRCDLPAKGKPNVSIQAYQGLPEVEHWAKVRDLRIVALED